jgi:hypothetical protein
VRVPPSPRALCVAERRVGVAPRPASLPHGPREQGTGLCRAGRVSVAMCFGAVVGPQQPEHALCVWGRAQFRWRSRLFIKNSFSIFHSVLN